MTTSRTIWAVAGLATVALVAVGGACSDDEGAETTSTPSGSATSGSTNPGAGGAGSTTGGGGDATSTGTDSGTSTGATYSSGVGGVPTHVSPCGADKIYECGDLEDNDGDGLIDSQDSDCLGPCDNTEDSYHADIPGDLSATCRVDCYWDNGNGSGNDECYWDHRCDPLAVGPDFPPQGEACAYEPDAAQLGGLDCDEAFTAQGENCLDTCRPLVPNGCDCFGCCELPAGGGEYVWLGSEVDNSGSCTQADVGDPSKCKPCTPVAGCLNDCAPCEICIGKPLPSDDCGGGEGGSAGVTVGTGAGGGGEQCPGGVTPCGLQGQAECAVGEYCITGCCVVVPN